MIGVLGLGSIGLRHGGNLLSLGRDVLAYDPQASRRRLFEDMGGKVTASRAEIFDRAAAVIIGSPNAMHLDDLADSVASGLHTFVEKPLSHTRAGVKEILARAQDRNLVVFAGLNLRFNPVIEAAKSALQDGRIGQPLWARFLSGSYLPDWRGGADYRKGYAADPRTGGVLFDIIHEFDLANYLLGPGRTYSACARSTGMLDMEAEDCADIVLEHESGVRSTIHIDYVTRPARRSVEVAGENGLLEIDIMGRNMKLYSHKNEVTLAHSSDLSSADDYLAEMRQFLRCIEHDEQPRCDGLEALMVLEQVLTARALSGLPSA